MSTAASLNLKSNLPHFKKINGLALIPFGAENFNLNLDILKSVFSSSNKEDLLSWLEYHEPWFNHVDRQTWIQLALERDDDVALDFFKTLPLIGASVLPFILRPSNASALEFTPVSNVERLLKFWPSLVHQNLKGETLVSYFAARLHGSMVKMLESHGADLFSIDEDGYNAGQSLFLQFSNQIPEDGMIGQELKPVSDYLIDLHYRHPNLIHPYRVSNNSSGFIPEVEWDDDDILDYLSAACFAIEYLGWSTQDFLMDSDQCPTGETWSEAWQSSASKNRLEAIGQLTRFELDLNLPEGNPKVPKIRL